MGDRYTITASADAVADRFGIEVDKNYKSRYNAAPTQTLPVITQGTSGFSYFYWGQIPDWSKNRSISTKLIHIPAETIEHKTATKRHLMTNRCVIPADGYYDWKKVSKKGRIPHRFIFGKNDIVSFPGIWEEFENEEGETFHTFRIITVSSNEFVEDLNERMPVIFKSEDEKQWLSNNADEKTLLALLKPFPSDKMGSYTVSPKFMDINNEGPDLIQPTAPADQFGNYSLFD